MKQFVHEAMQDRIVILPDEPEYTSEGGLLLTNVKKQQPTTGVVVAAGPGNIKDDVLLATRIQIGEKVVFPAGIGKQVRVEGKEYLVFKEEEILAIIGE